MKLRVMIVTADAQECPDVRWRGSLHLPLPGGLCVSGQAHRGRPRGLDQLLHRGAERGDHDDDDSDNDSDDDNEYNDDNDNDNITEVFPVENDPVNALIYPEVREI